MTEIIQTPAEQWPLKRAMLLSTAFLVTGLAAGWLIRGWESPHPGVAANSSTAVAETPAVRAAQPAATPSGAASLKQTADTEAAPLLEKLKADPASPDLLTSLGNLYYDAQQYLTAIDYYGRALQSRPQDANVRTDLGTAYWYIGNADAAIGEFNKALTYAPNNPNTLFNLGLVEWKGRKNAAEALADWQRLLAANPNYESRAKVEQMIAEVKSASTSRPGSN
jgi:tetratricopeptide (TPR) repeat protein